MHPPVVHRIDKAPPSMACPAKFLRCRLTRCHQAPQCFIIKVPGYWTCPSVANLPWRCRNGNADTRARRLGQHVPSAGGPQPYDGATGPRSKRERKPEWVRILEEDADNDPEVARLLEGTDGDPDKIREKMKFALKETDMQREGQGSDVPPQISFRAISPMGLWVWLEFIESPLPAERELLEGVLKSWFAVGKLGGYNSQNLQVYQNADDDQSYFEYDNDDLAAGETRMASYIHDMGEVEYQDDWARVRIDMGTADELALDILINMLVGFSADMAGLKRVVLGGSNADWPLPPGEEEGQEQYMKVGMDPMKLPEGLDEEFEFMDAEGMLEGGKGKVGGQYSGSGYGIQPSGGQYGATVEERELQELAAKLRRPSGANVATGTSRSATAGSRGPTRPSSSSSSRSGRKGGGYYGGGPDLVPDVDPDELEFTDEGEEGGGGKGAVDEATSGPRRPWGASFVRRVPRGGGMSEESG